jgi:hypothetical protein
MLVVTKLPRRELTPVGVTRNIPELKDETPKLTNPLVTFKNPHFPFADQHLGPKNLTTILPFRENEFPKPSNPTFKRHQDQLSHTMLPQISMKNLSVQKPDPYLKQVSANLARYHML